MPLWRTTSRKSNQDSSDAASMNQNDAAASASAAAGTEWLAGHLHHLTPEQEDKLREFKEFCAEKGYYKADVGDGSGKPSHEDETVLYVFFFCPRSFLYGVWCMANWIGGFFAHASSMWRLLGDSSRIRKIGDGIMRWISCMKISMWTPTSLRDAWYAHSFLHNDRREVRNTNPKKKIVPPMDRPSRPSRNPRLRLRNQTPKQPEHGRLHGEAKELEPARRSTEDVHRARAYAASVRAVREPPQIRDALVFDAAPASSGNADCGVQQYRRYQRCRAEAVLEPQGTYAGCECLGDGALSRDAGSDFCTFPSPPGSNVITLRDMEN